MFQINENSGLLQTRQSPLPLLDYETTKTYSFKVVATDREGNGHQTSTNVSVMILDENDNTPMFTSHFYLLEIPETIAVGGHVIDLNASDPDSAVFGKISYHIVRGSEGKFDIDKQTGVVQVVGKLDREKKDTYMVNISAADGGFYPNIGHTLLMLRVTDVNDNYPVFTKSNYDAKVTENSPIGSLVTEVMAVDQDVGILAEVTYSISSLYFNIDSKTGLIRTSVMLDREAKAFHTIIAEATDGGGLSANVSVNIKILDSNDNAPRFIGHQPLYTDLMEKSSIGTVVQIAVAEDEDEGSNAVVDYAIHGNFSDLFGINIKTGIIR